MFWQKQDNCPHRWFTCLRELESNPLCSHALVNTEWNLGFDQTRTFNIIYLEIESVCNKIYLRQSISTCVCIKIFIRQIFSFLQNLLNFFFLKEQFFYEKNSNWKGTGPCTIKGSIKPFYLYISFYNSQSVHVAIELSSTIHVLYAIVFLLVY